jgi:flavin reductase (DIM6/NTAB) family NADH-FMN oxidoreductase RutF
MKQDIKPVAWLFPNPALVVCTYDANGKANAATLAWGGIASSGPESVSIAVRPSRYTHAALLERNAFTINLPTAQYAAEADYFGIASGRNVDKFAATDLTPVKGSAVDAPYIQEFPYNMECEITNSIDLGAHTLFVGEVKAVHVDDSLVNEAGKLDWENADLLTYDVAARVYRTPGPIVAPAFSAGKKFM